MRLGEHMTQSLSGYKILSLFYSVFSLSRWFKNNSITGFCTLHIEYFHFEVASVYTQSITDGRD